MKSMKNIFRLVMWATIITITINGASAQKVDDERMRRDIEVAENVLGTLIRQQMNNQRTFFPLEIEGNYQAGYGVTFSLPADFTTPTVFSFAQGSAPVIVGSDMNEINRVNGGITYSYEYDEPREEGDEEKADRAYRLRDKSREKRRLEMDSLRDAFNLKVIDAAKTFIVDYADMITQLAPNEKIIITNQGGGQPRAWVNHFFNAPKRTHLSIESTRSDLTAFKQGKVSREQALKNVKVVNTETVSEVEPDLELLVTMFNRLYRADLSKTYFTENNIYYERLKDFGAIVYMSVYSGTEIAPRRFRMPTLGLEDVDAETRNKKVKEIYPKFEQELKENILEYGRTVKSLKDDEILVFQVKLTKCIECGIPSTLEYTVKGSVLKDLNSGKMDKNAALAKINLKKGANQ